MPKRGGTLYAIGTEGTALVKIGYTFGAVEQRVKTLQTGVPFPLRVIATLPVEQDVRQKEAYLHAFLSQERRWGEWFDVALLPEDFAGLLERAIAFGAAQEARRREEKARSQQRKPPAKRERQSAVDWQRFGTRVQTTRKALRLTQIDLADAVGISQGFLSQIEAGRRDVSTSVLVDLARTLRTNVDYLLGLEQAEEEKDSERMPALAS